MSSKSIMSNGSGGSFKQGSFHELHYASSTEERVKLAGDESKDRMYEPKRDKKMMRVVTVVVYVFSVSLAAIMLSLYYVFFWRPTGPHYAAHNAAALASANVTTTTTAVAPSCLHDTEESTDTTVVMNEDVAYSQYPVNSMYEDDTGSTEMTTDTTLSSEPSTETLFDPITAPTRLSRILGIKKYHGDSNNSFNNWPKRHE